MKDRTYNLRELCREADVTERTVRYYIKEGLLPPPHGSGPFSRYGYEHWLRMQFIKRLKDEYLPLSEIKNLLDSRSTGELDQLARRAGLIPGNAAPKGEPAAPDLVRDQLPGLIGGGSGRTRMLREQMASTGWPIPPVAASRVKMESSETGPVYNAATFKAAPELDIDAFADMPEAVSASFASFEPMENADLPDDEPEEIVAPPPPVYGAPAQARQAFPAQSFMASDSPTSGAASRGAGAPKPPAPGGGINRSVLASASPLRAMKMSRFTADEAAADLAGQVTNDMPPVEIPAAKAAPPAPAPMPMMARMAAPMAAPVQPPESAPETVTGQTWERIEVAPGIELHIEKRIADTNRPALANLLHSARRLFGPKEI